MNPVQRPDSFDVADYTGVLRRRWWVVAAIAVICLLGALAYIVVAPKTYTSSALVYVNATGADQSNQLANSRTQGTGTVNLDTEAQIVTSGTVAAMAGHDLHSSLTPYQLAHNVSVSVPPNSQTLLISCSESSASGAAACANAFAAAYLKNRSASAKAEINAQLHNLQSRVQSLQQSVASLNNTISGLPSNSSQAQLAKSRLGTDQGQLSSLNGKVSALVAEAANTSGGSILTAARPPSTPSSPKKSLVLPSGLVIGLLIGLIAAFIWDRSDKRIHTARDVERFFDLPVMLNLPRTAFSRQLALASPRSRTGKAFTELAHEVAASLGEGSHVILVAGTTAGPAASVVAANLAATLARTHSEAVLVCAALRDSVAPELFGLTDSRGLAEVVAGQATVGEVACGPAAVPGLWVIPPGADTSLAEYHLQHDTAKALTTQLRRDARYVVIEVQATEDGADTFALAEFADTALLAVEAQHTRRDDAQLCIQRLHRMRTPLLGVTLLPAIRAGQPFRPSAPPRAGSGPDDRRPRAELGRDGAAGVRGQGDRSALTGTSAQARQDRHLVRPARPAGGFGDPADRVPES